MSLKYYILLLLRACTFYSVFEHFFPNRNVLNSLLKSLNAFFSIFFLSVSRNISAYVAHMYIKLSSYTLSSFLKIFSEGFVNKLFLA